MADFDTYVKSHEARHICHVPLAGRLDHVWWLGFDCAHCGDVSPGTERSGGPDPTGTYKDIGYVRMEVERLARQLASGECEQD